MINRKAVGDRGEALARKFFSDRGYNIIGHNFRSRWGEIDLILRKDRAFRFVEVKFRHSLDFGLPQESVIPRKQRKIQTVALYWLRLRQLPMDSDIHFDVLAIHELRGQVQYSYIEDAF
jgi:putative endonuclease